MSQYKVINYVNENLEIQELKIESIKYDHYLRISILRLLIWLEKNILKDPNRGIEIKKKLFSGFSFDDANLEYIIKSYKFWKTQI
uniref:Uncharacterized protein n=1 Tax=Pithovirus LCPAC104 TaxID=2506589 RepID=A0A481Z453_9VIRU|nr:MAG: uncharacterized protein LCPAC104_01410 [Pithovirus LCPAC104]